MCDFGVPQGAFSVHEPLHTTLNGELFGTMEQGRLYVMADAGHVRWVYRDNAPGASDVFGPVVDSGNPTPGLDCIFFGASVSGPGLEGAGSDERVEVYPFLRACMARRGLRS